MRNKIRPMQLAAVGSDAAARIRLALLLTATVLVVEVVGGVWAHSLALLSDAGHVVTDLVVLALSAFALRQVQRPATARRTFGYQRVGILVALVNALLLGAIVVAIVVEALRRLQDPGVVRGGLMAAAAVVGLVISLIIARSLQPLGRDLTVKSALMHIWGEAWASGGIIVAGLLIAATGWLAIDPLLSLAIAGLIDWSAWRVVAEAINILLESTPADVRPAPEPCHRWPHCLERAALARGAHQHPPRVNTCGLASRFRGRRGQAGSGRTRPARPPHLVAGQPAPGHERAPPDR